MKLSCDVIRDLLPLYAEGLASGETAQLVEEHLGDCPACRSALERLRQPETEPLDSAAPLRRVKKTLRRRQLLAVLLVFLLLFAALARSLELRPLSCEEAQVRAERAENGLVISYDGSVSAVDTQLDTELGGPGSTLLLQTWTNAWYTRRPAGEMRGTLTVPYVPERVLYGYDGENVLLYGEPMNGGVELLPRLVLAYYMLYAAVLAAVFGLLWRLNRGKKAGEVFRALCLAALSYPLGHLLVKGTRTLSFFVPRDLAFILIAAAAVWGLLMLAWEAGKDRLCKKAKE